MSAGTVHEARAARVKDALAQQGLDVLCIRDTSNIAWLTGFEHVFDAERAHALAVPAVGPCVLHTDSRYASAATGAARETTVVVDAARDGQGRPKTHAAWLVEHVCNDGRFGGIDRPVRVGIEDTIELGEFRKLEGEAKDAARAIELVETTDVVLGLRTVKDDEEVRRLQAAQSIADAAFEHIVGFIRPGMTERQVQLELDTFMLAHGAEGLAFPSIVATGANGANPHAQPGDVLLEAGQCMVMDFGVVANGYCSDVTRMVFLGEPDERMRAAYDVLRQANEQVQAMLKPGVTGRQAHELAERILADGGFAGKMGHGLGHGVGCEVHEDPVLAPRNDQPLCAGNVVTVEPGIYLEGEFGMRLEDCGVITDDGYRPFSTIPHDMVVLPF